MVVSFGKLIPIYTLFKFNLEPLSQPVPEPMKGLESKLSGMHNTVAQRMNRSVSVFSWIVVLMMIVLASLQQVNY